MKNFGYMFGVGMVYVLFIAIDVSAGVYLLTHFPGGFDFGYYASVFTVLFLAMSLKISVPILRELLKDIH